MRKPRVGWLSFLTGGARDTAGKPDYYEEGLELARDERYHEALTSLRLALRERPGDIATLEQMGVVYTKMGMTDEALKMYQRALEKKTDSTAAHYGLGFLYLNKGETEAAELHLGHFMASAGDSKAGAAHVRHAEEALAKLRGLRSEPAEGTGAQEGDPGVGA